MRIFKGKPRAYVQPKYENKSVRDGSVIIWTVSGRTSYVEPFSLKVAYSKSYKDQTVQYEICIY